MLITPLVWCKETLWRSVVQVHQLHENLIKLRKVEFVHTCFLTNDVIRYTESVENWILVSIVLGEHLAAIFRCHTTEDGSKMVTENWGTNIQFWCVGA